MSHFILKRKTSLNKFYITSLFALFFYSFSTIVFALPYNPSETLDPSCTPGSASCYVNVLPDQTGNAGEILTTDGTTASWSSTITGGLTMAGDLAVNGGDITSTGTLTINSATTNALTIDSGTTGAINIGTGANAKTVTIGNTTGASALTLDSGTGAISIGTGAQARSINIGTGNAIQTITIGNATPASTLTLNSGVTTGTAFTINNASLTSGNALNIIGPSSSIILQVGYDNTDPWDGSRVSIGDARGFDQLYVDGRINYTWNLIWEDFLGYPGSLSATDGNFGDFYFDTQGTDACIARNSVVVGGTVTSSGTIGISCSVAGANAWLGTNGNAIVSPGLFPVMEARLQATANSNHRFVLGFLDAAADSSTLGSSDTNSSANEIMFRKAASETYWEAVTRSASGTEVVTELTSYSTSTMRQLRFEVETGEVRFYIDNTLVATHASGIPSSTYGLGFYAGNAVSTSSSSQTTIDYIRIWSDDPLPGQFTEEELLAGEEASRTALEIPIISPVIQEVTNFLRDTAEKVIDGIVRIVNLFVDSLTVGSREHPSGITIFDEVTGDPYCMKVRNGQQILVAGECTSAVPVINEASPSSGSSVEVPVSDEVDQESEESPVEEPVDDVVDTDTSIEEKENLDDEKQEDTAIDNIQEVVSE